MTLPNGAHALAWQFDVDGSDEQVRHVDVLREGLVVVTLWTRVEAKSDREAVQRRLESILATLQVSDHPIHVNAK